ncbi:S8 family peptidase [Cryptosporangium sp. NPDC051539]|uniref:S8 family peptidase n=1 Tax=Cryptosporangium sp. NPDC051539 TaxID=3363962 RepID=UPI0037BA27D2
MESAAPTALLGVNIELRGSHPEGVDGARRAVSEMVETIAPEAPIRAGRSYLSSALTARQIRELVVTDRDLAGGPPEAGTSPDAPPGGPSGGPSGAPDQARLSPPQSAPRWAIHRIWPNFEVRALTYRTVTTTKCDASLRAFRATGAGLVWAVLDSGIDGTHAHFERYHNLVLPAGLAHRSFVHDAGEEDPLVDNDGHGTHVAGIIAGESMGEVIAATYYQDDSGNRTSSPQTIASISGMAPQCTLLSFKVLRSDGSGDTAALLDALEYVSEVNNGGRDLRVHGVNLSVGYPFDPSWFSAGQTPVCREVDRLVRSGVVVVAAAGNTGYGYAFDSEERQVQLGLGLTINDPGNAECAITVGATSTRPHLTGVSHFSSKGPTGDGRLKPDLVAPGERVVSAAAGQALAEAEARVPGARYVENSGTSMAAPHVSGVAAGFLSVHQEFLGRPEDVKRILLASATDLGRDPTFQGRGLVDAMRAIQSV